jgi:tRNA-splicing endonuclease subunit Sen34
MEDEQDGCANFRPDLPIPISYIAGRYMLFDVRAVSYIRREYNLCGYNIGTLPQHPSQNVFLGLPTLIMPEEAQFLIDEGVGFLLDDARAHDRAVYERNKSRKAEFLAKVRRQAKDVEQLRAQEHEAATRRALSRRTNTKNTAKGSEDPQPKSLLDVDDNENAPPSPEPSTTRQPEDTPVKLLTTPASSSTYHVTPTTSRLLLSPGPPSPPNPTSPTSIPTHPIPSLPPSYPLFAHLHKRNYFLSPGLRFGCQYSVYPGDPLRFHSHFLAISVGWEEEIDLLDLVGGGRLGTGVKKGFLVGGVEPRHAATSKEGAGEEQGDDGEGENSGGGGGEEGERGEGKVRTFSIEWAEM